MIMEACFLYRKVVHHFPLLLFYDIDLEFFCVILETRVLSN